MKIEANGILMGYDLTGNPNGPVITLSHSLATTRQMWWHQLDALEDNYRILRYDTRGHGETEVPDAPYDIPLLANDVAALLRALEIEQTHFVGLSMGGMIGQHFAATHPQLVNSITLCATACQMPPEAAPAWNERIEIANTQGMDGLVNSTVERWFTKKYIRSNEQSLARVREMIRQSPPHGFVCCGEAIKVLAQLNILKEIRCPTLLLVGEEDPSTPPAASQLIKENVAGAQMKIVKQASHLLNIEQPETFNKELVKFLAAH
tara:strand:+ start:647 stop:1435 length:789 start_codon:yes stop_codon:yes gene_type:complete